jgi:hypothetical protein
LGHLAIKFLKKNRCSYCSIYYFRKKNWIN